MSFDVAGEAYDRFMGRYSSPLAGHLVHWLEVAAGQRVLDVGCGPGALTGHLVARVGAANVAAIDPSEPFVAACRDRHPGVDVRVGAAEALPYDDDSHDVAAACLVVHFMADPVAGLAEMGRVTRPGGRVGAVVWDLAGRRAPMWPVWKGIAEVAPDQQGEAGRSGGAAGELVAVLEAAGLHDVEATELSVTVTHPSFEEWWQPYLHGVGPIGEALAALEPEQRERVAGACRRQLGDGPFDITAVAYAARGRA